MAGERPNISERQLEEITRFSLLESGMSLQVVDEIAATLWETGTFEALEQHIEREIARPSLKGPGPHWSWPRRMIRRLRIMR